MISLSAIKAKIFNRSSSKSVATLTTGTVLAQGITVGATPFLSRLFSPSEFGALALFISVIAVVSTLACLRYDVNILVPKESKESNRLLGLCIALAIPIGFATAIISWIAPDHSLGLLGLNPIKSWVPLACLTGMVTAITTAISTSLNRSQKYKQISLFKVLQSCAFVSLSLILGVYGFREGFLAAQSASAIIGLIALWRYMPSLGRFKLIYLTSVAKKYRNTVKYMLPSALLDAITWQIPVLLISSLYGASSAGQFSLAWRVLVLPAALLGTSIGQVFFQRFSVAWPDGTSSWKLLTSAWKSLAIIGFVPMMIVIFFGRGLFSWVFGANWGESGTMAAILAPMLFVSLLHSPTSTSSIILGLQRPVFFISLFVLVCRPLSLWIGWRLGSLYHGLLIYSMMEVLHMGIFQYIVYRKINSQVSFQIQSN